jgi:hypothetical protein
MVVESNEDVNKSSAVKLEVEDTLDETAASCCSSMLAVPQDFSPSHVEETGWDNDDAFDVPDEEEEEAAESLVVVSDMKMSFENSNVAPSMLAADLDSRPLAAEETGWDNDDDVFEAHVQDDEDESFMPTLDDDKVNTLHVVVRESDLADQQPVDLTGQVEKKEPVDFYCQEEKDPSLNHQVVSEEVNDEAKHAVLEAFDETKGTLSPAECESHVETGVDKTTHESIVSDYADEHNLVASSNNHDHDGVTTTTTLEDDEPMEHTGAHESHVEPCVVDNAHESIDNDEHDAFASSNDHDVTPDLMEAMANAPPMTNGDDVVDECHQPKRVMDDFDNFVRESNETVEEEEEEVILPQVSPTKVNDEAIDGMEKSQIKSPDEAVLETDDDLKDEFVEDDAEEVDHVAPDALVGARTDDFKDKSIEEHVVEKAKAHVAPDTSTVSVTDVVSNEGYTEKVEVTNEAPIAPDFPSQSSRAVQQEEFALELQRLKDAHQAEVSSLEQRHANQLQEALASFNHDQCQTERQEMEQRFMGVIRGHEGQLQELMSENEGYQLKIGVLKKEVAGKHALLEQRYEWQLVVLRGAL